jgi:2-methylcitrate dehydratase PrpD
MLPTSNPLITRRSVLQRAGWTIAAWTLPWRLAMAHQDNPSVGAAQTISPVMTKLSAYMSAARDRELPEEVGVKAKHHILDTLAAMVSGSGLLPGREAIRFARQYGGNKIATVVASDVLCGPIEAAMANAELAHSDETDDYDPRNTGHPGCAIVPGALALGEQLGVSGTHFLRAVMLGYDIGLRTINTVGAGTAVKDTHIMLGTFGAAAAGGCIAGLRPRQMQWLLRSKRHPALRHGAAIPNISKKVLCLPVLAQEMELPQPSLFFQAGQA